MKSVSSAKSSANRTWSSVNFPFVRENVIDAINLACKEWYWLLLCNLGNIGTLVLPLQFCCVALISLECSFSLNFNSIDANPFLQWLCMSLCLAAFIYFDRLGLHLCTSNVEYLHTWYWDCIDLVDVIVYTAHYLSLQSNACSVRNISFVEALRILWNVFWHILLISKSGDSVFESYVRTIFERNISVSSGRHVAQYSCQN